MTEKIKQQVLEEIHDYLKANIEDFDLEAQLALRKMDRYVGVCQNRRVLHIARILQR